MQLKRKFLQKMKKSDTLRTFMKDKNVIISGKNSEDLLKFFEDTYDLVDNDDEK
jgi:hypothetical protein